MTRHHRPQRDCRARITAAAVTGVLAGITRAILDTVLHHLIT